MADPGAPDGPSPDPGAPAQEAVPAWATGSAGPAPPASEPALAPGESAPDRDDTPAERFLHERLIGSAARALAVTLGLSPASLFGLLTGADGGDLLELHLGALAVTLPIFFLERRDAWRWGPVLGRAALGGALGSLLAVMTSMWIGLAGDPGSAFGLFQARVLRFLPQLLGVGLGVAAFAPLWALPFLVRARTSRPGPFVAACLLLALALVTPVAAVERARAKLVLGCAAVLLTGALVPLLVLIAEARLRVRGDPRAPLPPDADPSRRIATWGLLALLALSLVTASSVGPSRRGDWTAIGALKTLCTAEVLFAQADKNSDGTMDYAGNLGDLRDDGQLIDATFASGVKQGYVFRLTRRAGKEGEEFWAAAADPVSGPSEGSRRFWISQAGQIYYAPSGADPAPLDPEKPPPGWHLLGK